MLTITDELSTANSTDSSEDCREEHTSLRDDSYGELRVANASGGLHGITLVVVIDTRGVVFVQNHLRDDLRGLFRRAAVLHHRNEQGKNVLQ